MAGQAGPEVTSDDKLWSLLTYVFTPLVPIIILLMEDKKKRPFLKAHNAQALILGIIYVILWGVLFWTVCVPFIVWIYAVYCGIQAYGGKYVEIPIVTKLCKDQGWA
jgi:uncharacterized membrane protein